MEIKEHLLHDKFSAEALEIIGLAHEIAGEFKQPRVGTSELLAALVHNETIAQVLSPIGVEASMIRRQVLEVSGFGTSADDPFIRPFTADAEAVLEEALKTAVSFAHDHVGPVHLLLAIMAIQNDGCRILVRCGADLEEVARLAKDSLKHCLLRKEPMNPTITDTSVGSQHLTHKITRTARVLVPRDHQPGREVVLQSVVVNAPLEKDAKAVVSVLNDQFSWTELLALSVSEWRPRVPLPDRHGEVDVDKLTTLADDLLARASRMLGA